MEGEMYIFAQVWLTAFLSLCYCHSVVAKLTHKGLVRLICVLPVFFLFLALPLRLHSVHLCGNTAFFLSWLANFKLLLFAFGIGPLSPHLSLLSFVALACLPIKILQHPSPKSDEKIKENPSSKPQIYRDPSQQNGEIRGNPSQNFKFGEEHKLPPKGYNSIFVYAIKILVLGVLIRSNDYSEHIHPKIILVIYCFHIYLCLEIMLAVFAALARVVMKLELEPQFNEPYFSTSLQDFWGRRWNLMVTGILRPTVYEPVRNLSSRAVGRKLATLPAVMATFVVSAAMHELMFYYLSRVRPTWEITWFFVLHGTCLVAEIVLKRVIAGKFRLPGVVSGGLTIGFVMVTGFWLFFPQLLRCKADVRAFEEYAAVGAWFRDIVRGIR